MDKEKPFIKKNKFAQLWLIIGIIAGFGAILFFLINYLNQKILCNIDCKIQNQVSIALILISLFGMFVGSFTYYFISEKYEKKIIKMQKEVNLTLRFLEKEEKAIVSVILNNGGKITQSEIFKETGMSRVRVFRGLKKLEEKNVIVKRPYGMTNSIELEQELKKVLID